MLASISITLVLLVINIVIVLFIIGGLWFFFYKRRANQTLQKMDDERKIYAIEKGIEVIKKAHKNSEALRYTLEEQLQRDRPKKEKNKLKAAQRSVDVIVKETSDYLGKFDKVNEVPVNIPVRAVRQRINKKRKYLLASYRFIDDKQPVSGSV